MHIHHLSSEISAGWPIKEVFAFFSDAADLDSITPTWLSFRTVKHQPIEMHAGTVIDYRAARTRFFHLVDRLLRRRWLVGGPQGKRRKAAFVCQRVEDNAFHLSRQKSTSTGLVADAASSFFRAMAQRNCWFYCARNAFIGSTFVARSAGT
jgi:hypothetical protein